MPKGNDKKQPGMRTMALHIPVLIGGWVDRLKAIQVFVEAASLGSLTAAANKLEMSRAMATRYIAALEKTLGVRLLHRTNRSLGPTDAGSNILAQCKQISELAGEIATVTANNNAEPSGKVRIAGSNSFSQWYLAEAIRRFAERFPKTSVELIMTDHPPNLLEERIDIAFFIGDPPDPNVVARKLAPCPMVLCAAPSYLDQNGAPEKPCDLVAHNCLIHTRNNGRWRFAIGPLGRPQGGAPFDAVAIGGKLIANDAMLLLKAALDGRGIVCLPLYAAKSLLASGALTRVLPNDSLFELGIFALYPSRHHIPATTRAMVDFVANELSRSTPAFIEPIQPSDSVVRRQAELGNASTVG